jgi:pyruvate/2-oxoglutarate dehydrogenase complex dihydrolipoamide dehydrogenase (E3) component
VVVIGGSATGCETAELLADDGCEVTIVEMLPSVGRGIELVTRRRLIRGLREAGVALLTRGRVTSIEADRIVYEREDGGVEALECDRVALAIGWRARGAELVSGLNGRPHIVVGDASTPSDFVAAINAGADAGLAV